MNGITPAAYAANLRTVAALIEANPQLPLPAVFAYGTGNIDVSWQILHNKDDDQAQRDTARAILAAVGGKWDKKPWDDADVNRFDFTQKRDGMRLEIYARRDAICERVVTGTETVTREVPDPDALAAVPTTTVTDVVETVEWRCEPILTERVTA